MSLDNDDSWIKKDVENANEDVDEVTTRSIKNVNDLIKRFSSDETRSSTLPSSKSTSSYTKTKYSSGTLDYPSSTSTFVSEEPKSSTTTTTVTKDGKTTETTISTYQSLRSPVNKSPTKATFSDRVMSSRKEPYSSYSPTKTTKVTETTVTSNKDAEDKLYGSLIPSSIKGDFSPTDSKRTISTTETVVVRSSPDTDAEDKFYDTLKSVKDDSTKSKTTITSTERVTVRSSSIGDTSTTTTKTSSAEDDLYGTLLPRAITSNQSSPSWSSQITKNEVVTVESSRGGDSPTLKSPSSTRRVSSYSYSDDAPSTRTTSYTTSTKPSYDYSNTSSPNTYSSSYRSSSRSDDNLGDSVYSSSFIKSVYAAPERTVLEKDLCTSCRKPFTADAKMVLDDMKINCHATCFKCAVCNCSLEHLKAGDSMWIYKRMVHCENCFEVTREKWRR